MKKTLSEQLNELQKRFRFLTVEIANKLRLFQLLDWLGTLPLNKINKVLSVLNNIMIGIFIGLVIGLIKVDSVYSDKFKVQQIKIISLSGYKAAFLDHIPKCDTLHKKCFQLWSKKEITSSKTATLIVQGTFSVTGKNDKNGSN